jgi:tRNA 2-thiouridine synthesizing protein A
MSTTRDAADAVPQVDLTGEVCPMTFVRAKLRLEELLPGELVEFVLQDGEQLHNVPPNLKSEGHRIETVTREGDRWFLLVRRGADGC